MTISAKAVEHSISGQDKMLMTMQLTYPRFIHAEFMTHRVFSRNASSSRAIPVAKMIEQVRTNPAMPVHWGKNQPGMQAHEEHDAPVHFYPIASHGTDRMAAAEPFSVKQAWIEAAARAAEIAEAMNAAGYHKQVVNRILEPFQHIHVVVTASEWDNFFELRDHPDAQPEIRVLAQCMKEEMTSSEPVLRPNDRLSANAWHLPYVTAEERTQWCNQPQYLARLSVARCARVSYLTHDGSNPDHEKDNALYQRLVGSRPLHASPTEHQGYPLTLADQVSNNFRGWRQYRDVLEVNASYS